MLFIYILSLGPDNLIVKQGLSLHAGHGETKLQARLVAETIIPAMADILR